MAYPSKPTGDNIIPLNDIFAENNDDRIVMSTQELTGGYNNSGSINTLLTSTPDANRFNNLLYQFHNTIAWLVKYVDELFADKVSKTGATMSGNINMNGRKIQNIPFPTLGTDAVNKNYVDTAVSGNSMWISEIKCLAYPSIPTLPAGVEVVPCDGRAISRTTYSELFALIGTAFGAGNGSTTFNIPDYRGLFIRGWDGGSNRDSGRIYGTIQQSGVPNITGRMGTTESGSDSSTGCFYRSGKSGSMENVTGAPDPNVYFDASRSSSIYQNGLNEARPINSTGYYVIRIK